MSRKQWLCDFIAGNGKRVRMELFPNAPLVRLRVGSESSSAVLSAAEARTLRESLDEFFTVLAEEAATGG